jgi:hypothetical protein
MLITLRRATHPSSVFCTREAVVEQRDSDDALAKRASIRDGKDRVVADVVGLASGLDMRVMRGGGSVFASHGLISPEISPFVALIVDPARIDELTRALTDNGWTWRRESLWRVLPPTIRSFERADFADTLNLYSVIPGFFSDPQENFERIWSARDEMVSAGRTIPVLGKLPTIMFAAHHRLDGQRWTRATELHFTYFLAQFQNVLFAGERVALQRFARDLGAEDEVRGMLLGLGLELTAPARPHDAYLRDRLGLESVRPGDAWLVTRLERPRGRRVPFPGVAAASAALYRLFGARRRLGL